MGKSQGTISYQRNSLHVCDCKMELSENVFVFKSMSFCDS